MGCRRSALGVLLGAACTTQTHCLVVPIPTPSTTSTRWQQALRRAPSGAAAAAAVATVATMASSLPSTASRTSHRCRTLRCAASDSATPSTSASLPASEDSGTAADAIAAINAFAESDSSISEGSGDSVVVSREDHNAPIDWILSRRLPTQSRRFYRKALESGDVKVNGRTVKRFVRVASGSKISVNMRSPSSSSSSSVSGAASGAGAGVHARRPRSFLFPERLPSLRVLYEDKHCAVVMKPAGMICQPCEAAPKGTVLHGLLYHMVQTGQVKEGDESAATTLSQGIVQRLDKNTSGVMVIAKGLSASSKFSSLFKKAKVRKEYVAICHGDPGFDSLIDAPLYRRSSGKVAAVEAWDKEEFGAKDAQTRVRNVATAAGVSLCRAEIITGRMHQVRVHLKWKGCPIVGDKEYGDWEANDRVSRRNAFRVDARRPLLHSMTLEFTHPFTNKPMSFRAPMPFDMWETAEKILRSSGTQDQRQEFAELQELHQVYAGDTAPIGGRGAPRFSRKGAGRKGGRGGAGAREAYEAVTAAGSADS